MNKMGQNLSDKSVSGLARAYMYLYKKLVSAYQSNGNSVGQSQFNAICVMRTILSEFGKDKKNPAVKFLSKLYNTHRGIVAKKVMVSPNKDDVVVTVPENSGLAIALAISELEDAITSGWAPTLTTLCRLPTVAIPQNPAKRPNFVSWVGKEVSLTDIKQLQKNPAYFGKLYKRYVMCQSHR